MSPLESASEALDQKYVEMLAQFVADIRNGKIKGSLKVASETVSLMEKIINHSQNATSAYSLVSLVSECGHRLSQALPQELVAANMVRRVLRAIRDECRPGANQSSEGAGESLQRLVLAAPARRSTLGPSQQDLAEPIRDHISELRLELESSISSIRSQASEHVESDELVLTYGSSGLVESFLRAAPAKYKLLVVEGTEHGKSHAMAARLSAAGVSVTVVTTAAVFGVMCRVNKVIVGTIAALAGGALLSEAGLHSVTTAAAHYSVPVIVLAPLYKLSPLYACDQHHYNALAPPHRAISYESVKGGGHVYAPMYDFVPPEHVTLFITNLGGSSPSYMYRLLSELYDPKDYQL